MYYPNYPNYSIRQRKRFTGTRLLVICILSFTFLLISALEYWMALPAWQVRLHGVQTSAVAHIAGECDDDDGSVTYAFSYTFEDARGDTHRVTQDSFCTNVIDEGSHVTLWYMTEDPKNILTDFESYMLYGFSGAGILIAIVDLIIVLVLIFRPLFAGRSRSSLDYSAARFRQEL